MPTRSPLNVWLFFSATICVTAVAALWLRQSSGTGGAAVLFFALCFSQLSIACIWTVIAAPRQWRHWIAPIVGAVLPATVMHSIAPPDVPFIMFIEALGIFALHAMGVILAILLLPRLPMWRRLTGQIPPGELRYSVASLLALTAIVAVLLTLLKQNETLREMPALSGLYLAGYVLIVVAIVTAWPLRWPRPMRLAIPLAAAGALGLFFDWWSPHMGYSRIAPDYLIQIAVIWLWLEVGHIMPRREPFVDGNAPPTTPSPPPQA